MEENLRTSGMSLRRSTIVVGKLLIAAGAFLSLALLARGTAAPPTVTMANPVPINSAAEVWTFPAEGFEFFARQGLQVRNLFNNGGAVSFGQVATGQSDFAESSLENVINAIQAGEPIHPFAALITTSVWTIGVPENSPIQSSSELAGKKIGVTSLTSGSYPFAQIVAAENGLTGKGTYPIVGNGGPGAHALSSGQVDALGTTDQEWATIQHLGVKVRFLPQPTIASLPSDLLFTSKRFYQDHKDLCVKFAAAVFAGIARAQERPVQALDYFEKLNPEVARVVPRDVSATLLKSRLTHVALIPAQQGQWGYMATDLYATVQDVGLQYGAIKKPGIDVRATLSNELVPAINDDVRKLLGQ